MADSQRLGEFYESLSDEELQRMSALELIPEASRLLQAEMKLRGLAPAAPPAEPPARRRFSLRNPYLPPAALIADLNAEAVISARGLVTLFQSMVIASTAVGVFLWLWPYLPLPISAETMTIRDADGIGALFPAASYWVLVVLQPVWVVTGIGLFFFLWWGRLLLAASYAIGVVANLAGGMVIWLPWELALVTIATLLDGAVLTLAFLPPLSKYFERP
jgi:hypothetical protein